MSVYDDTSHQLSEVLIRSFSTSFSLGSKFFSATVRVHVANIYGFARIADEVVDTYQGNDAHEVLLQLQADTHKAIERQFSPNPILHAFAATARAYGIDRDVIDPFFTSMLTDTTKKTFNQNEYDTYIFGSAEVIGLMCLRVFVEGDKDEYQRLAPGAQALGAAFQKANFLRDLAEDYQQLGRYYFPIATFKTFDNTIRDRIVSDIEQDFAVAETALSDLPASARLGVRIAFVYFKALLHKLAATDATVIKAQRIRIADSTKLILLAQTVVREAVRR